jgi:hypothetical protein
MEKSVIGGGHTSDPEQDPLMQEEEDDSKITFACGTTSTQTGVRIRGLEHSYRSEFDQEPRTPSVFQEEGTRDELKIPSSSRAATGGRAAAEEDKRLLEEYDDEAWDFAQRGMALIFLRKLNQERKAKKTLPERRRGGRRAS